MLAIISLQVPFGGTNAFVVLKPSNLCALSRRPFSLGTLPSSRDGWFFAPRNPSSMILTNSFLTYFFLVYVVLHSPLLLHRRFVVERRTFDFALNRNAYVISRLLATSSLASVIATTQLFAVVKVVHLVIKEVVSYCVYSFLRNALISSTRYHSAE